MLFDSEQYLFRWANDTVQVIRAPTRISRGALVDGVFYTTMPESGLNVLEGDRFRALPGTEALAREVYPVVLRYDERRLLIATRSNGLFLYDGAALTRFPTEMDGVFIGGTVYRGVELPDRSFAIATTGTGLVIIDRQGRRVAHITRDNGLRSNAVYSVMADREGAIWVMGEPGLARIETPSPASFFDATDGFVGYFNHTRHDGRLYLAAQSGVMYLHPAAPGDRRRFSRLPGIDNQCWWFEDMDDPGGTRPAVLAVACSDGLYEIQGLTTRPIRAPADGTYRTSALLRSGVDPTRLWVALFDGLASFRRVDGRWIDEGRVEGVIEQIRGLSEREDGSLWAGTSSRGVLHISFATTPEPGRARPALATAERFGEKEGLQDDGVFVNRVGDTVYFTRWTAGRRNFAATLGSGGQALRQRSRVRSSAVRRPECQLRTCRPAGWSAARQLRTRPVGRHPYADWLVDVRFFGVRSLWTGQHRVPGGRARRRRVVQRSRSTHPLRPVATGGFAASPLRGAGPEGGCTIGSRPLRWCRGRGVTASAVGRRHAALRVRRADVSRRDRHRIPDPSRRSRRRLVGVVAASRDAT